MRFALLPSLLLACLWLGTADAQQTPEQWLTANAHPLGGVSFGERDFSELEPIGAAIGDSRVVLLGEASHGDGSTFEAKARLIRYLHEVKGFNVLAWEAGMWGMHEMNRILEEGGAPVEAARAGLFPIWADSAQAQDVFEYAAATKVTSEPLTLVGFDPNITGNADITDWIEFVLGYIEGQSPGLLDPQLQADLRDIPISATGGPPSLDSLLAYQAKARAALERWNSANSADSANLEHKLATRLLKQLGDSPELGVVMLSAPRADTDDPQAAQAAQWEAFKAMANERERQMIGNLIWLAEEVYPDEKIIVWAASAHCLRNFSRMTYPTYREDLTNKVSLGQGIYDALGTEVYALAITAGGGQTGTPGKEPSEIPPPEPGSLEDFLLATQSDCLFIDLRGTAESFRQAFGTELSAAPLGYAPMIGDWTAAADGMLFIAWMEPSMMAAEQQQSDAPDQPQ